jgi:hypothetical protein
VVELDDLTVVLGKLPALVSRTELELSLHDLDEPRELNRARTEPDLSDSIPLRQNGAVKRPTAPESAAGLEAVLGLDRTIRLCHVRGAAVVALSGRPPGTCASRVMLGRPLF